MARVIHPWLAQKGKVISHRALEQVATLVTPDTTLARDRNLIALQWTYKKRRGPKRPTVIRLRHSSLIHLTNRSA